MKKSSATLKRLGDYIQEVDVRNRDLQCSNLLGLSVSKVFISSVANTIGTDMRSYKIVEKNQFAYVPVTSRNGEKITVALYDKKEECIVSQAYTVFKIIDEKTLLPEYLMMWFRRPEFDRYARFHSHGSAREVFDWEEMCEVQIPVPAIEEQRRIVARYQAIQNRIEINKQMISRLESAAQALYRKMFVDDIDPENLAVGWRMGTLGEVCSLITKGTTPKEFTNSGIKYIKAESISDLHNIDLLNVSFIDDKTNNLLKRSVIQENDILFTIAGTLGKFSIVSKKVLPLNTNQAVAIIRVDKTKVSPWVVYAFFIAGFHLDYCRRNVQESVQANFSLTTLSNIPIIMSDNKTLNIFENQVRPIFKHIQFLEEEIELLQSF